MNSGDDMESYVDFHMKDEAQRLIKEIELMMKNVENSKFYAGILLDLKQNETIRKHLIRLLGSHPHVQVVIYGLGSIESNYNSQFQLAVVLLLKRDFSKWIDNIEIYDPTMSPVDIIVFKELGLEVLTIDENCKRTAQRPTMFYMPNPEYHLIGNLLGANWSSSGINQIFLLTNSLRDTFKKLPLCGQNNLETMIRLRRILQFTTEIGIKTSDGQMYANWFSGFAWHFFDVDPNIDIDKPGHYWLDMQSQLEAQFLCGMLSEPSDGSAHVLSHSRVPHYFRCKSVPLTSGLVNLYIYGIGTKGDQPGRFGGVFQDHEGNRLGRYKGNIYGEDDVIAGLVALRLGLARCKEGKPKAEKLIVQSDNFMLVQYVNGLPEPNKKTTYMLKEILDLLKCITCEVYHVYEEANKNAKDWVLRNECPNNGPNAASGRKLYVGNLPINMTELQLRQIFVTFGQVELVQLTTDPETGHCKGFGFVQFAQLEHAKAAQSLNCEIGGRTIKVSFVTEHVGVQDAGAETADLGDDAGGLALDALSSAMLMAKLDSVSVASGVAGTLGVPAAAPAQPAMSTPMGGATAFPNMLPAQVVASMAPEPIGIPSECLLLKNMFDPATEMDPEFDLAIKDDVKEECSKYGRVNHIHADKNSSGYVYLRFDSVEAASHAQQAMHKKWFAGRSISAIFLQPWEYDAKFKGTS